MQSCHDVLGSRQWRTEGDTVYRSNANEEFMEKNGFVSHVHR
jgi:hypothetical protein